MDARILLATAILIIALPMTGSLCAMVLSVLLAARRRPRGARLVTRFAWLDPLTTRMRLAAGWLGSSLVEDAGETGSVRANAEVQPRRAVASPGRRERRLHARRRHPRLGRERRQSDRRDALAG